MDILLNCPFCGGKASIKHKTFKGILNRAQGFGYWGSQDESRTLYWVGCDDTNKDCFHPKTYGDKEDAIDQWNTRNNKDEKMETKVTDETTNINKDTLPYTFSFSDMRLISHSLGIDLFKSVMSMKLKDKKLPRTFYRNYYHASQRQATEILGIPNLIKLGYLAIGNPEYYYVTEKGIKQFRTQFSEMAIYKKKSERDIAYLKHRINFYCSFYHYKFCDDNSRHVIDAYNNYWIKKFRVSHTTEDVIKQFKLELKRFFKPSNL